MKTKVLNVGQVVYVLSNKAQAILPALVVQEHRTKHLKGEDVTWTIQYGPPGRQKTVESHKIDGELYSSLNEVQQVMNSNFEKYVAELVEKASAMEQKWYPRHQLQAGLTNPDDRLDPETMMQEVEETYHTTQAPTQFQPTQFQSTPRSAVDARERLKQIMTDDAVDVDSDERMKLLPDGTVVAG